jgi:hypothetical protein
VLNGHGRFLLAFATPTAIVALAPGDAEVVQVRFTPETQMPGVYEANLVLTSNDVTSPVVRVPVTLTVLDEALRVSPLDAWSISGPQGGEFTTESTELVVSNAGSAAITWSVDTGTTWCEVVPAGGSLAAARPESATLRLTNEAYSVGIGVYTAQVEFSNPATGSVYRRVVHLDGTAVYAGVGESYWFPLDTDRVGPFRGSGLSGRRRAGRRPRISGPDLGTLRGQCLWLQLGGGYPNSLPRPIISLPNAGFLRQSSIYLQFWRCWGWKAVIGTMPRSA